MFCVTVKGRNGSKQEMRIPDRMGLWKTRYEPTTLQPSKRESLLEGAGDLVSWL